MMHRSSAHAYRLKVTVQVKAPHLYGHNGAFGVGRKPEQATLCECISGNWGLLYFAKSASAAQRKEELLHLRRSRMFSVLYVGGTARRWFTLARLLPEVQNRESNDGKLRAH